MSAVREYERHQKYIVDCARTVDVGFATFLLKLPVPMSYEVWSFLHKVKGDY